MARRIKQSRHGERQAEKKRQRLARRNEVRKNWDALSGSHPNLPTTGARLVELTIFDGPADLPEFQALPAELQQEIEPFLSQEHDDYSAWVPQLEDWISRGADVPQLYNRLAGGYNQAGRDADCDAMVRRTYERFPDYFFGKVGYAQLRLEEGHPDEVLKIIGGSFAIDQIAGRSTLHSSEVRAWGLLMVKYWIAMGNVEQAQGACALVRSVAPDRPLTESLERMIQREVLSSALQRVQEIMQNEDRLLRYK